MRPRYGHHYRPRGWGRGKPGRGGLWIVPEYHGTDPFYATGGLFRVLWRYRGEMAPFYWLAGVMLIGAWMHHVHPSWWPVPIAAGAASLVALWWLPRALLEKWPLLARWRIRLYGACFTATVASWTAVATIIGVTAGSMESYAFLATLCLGLPWWWREDRRRLTRVRILRDKFPETAETVGLEGAHMVSALITKWGWTARIRLRRGQHFPDAVDALPRLESALGAPVGSLRAEAVKDNAAEVTLRMVETDPHAAPIEYPARLGKRPASITHPVTLGVWEDGTDVSVSLLRRHVLVGGATDSGKSGVLNVILARLAECSDAIVWGIDLKEGMELAPWANVLSRLATNPADAENLLRAAVVELNRRAAYLADQGKRTWEPTPAAPALVVMIDEYAELTEAARKLADTIARLGRAVAVTLLIATQRPTQKTMGEGSAIRSQMNIRICLRVTERGDVELVLGKGKLAAGWDSTTFDAPGKFLLSAPGHDTPRRARSYWITDQTVKATADRNTRTPNAGQPATDPDQPHDTAPGGPGEPIRAPGAAQPGSGVSGPDMALWEALRAAPDGGARITALMAATGQSRTAVYRRLQTLAAQGRAVQATRGRWTATGPGRTRPPHPYQPPHP